MRTWRVPALYVTVLATAIAAGYAIHVRNRVENVREFQEQQGNSVATVAGVLQASLTGSSRTLRVIAAASVHSDARDLAGLLRQETEADAGALSRAITIFGPRGEPILSAVRQVALDAEQMGAALEWARVPENVSRVRSAIARTKTPALVLMSPREGPDGEGAGFVAEEVPFDALFAAAHMPDRPPLSSAFLVISRDGDVLFRTGHPEMRLNNIYRQEARCRACHASLAHVDRIIRTQSGTLQYDVRGRAHLAAMAPVSFESNTWIAAAMSPADAAVARLTTEVRQFAAISFASILGLGFVMRMTSRERQARLEADVEASRKEQMQRSHAALTALNAKLESAADEWRMTVDTIDSAIVVLDSAGNIARMNRVASDLLPGPTFSWLGRPSSELASLPPWPSALVLAAEAIERDGVSTARIRDASGSTWDLWCRAPRRPDHRGSVVIVARDVTALVELQASVRRSETMAALGLVVAGVAHEVRNPLFAISSLVDAWALQPKMEPARLVGALRHQVGRVKTLMTELLEYGSPAEPDLSPQPLARVIEDAMAACEHEFAGRDVRVVVGAIPDVQVWMDTKRLVRVFINLLQNAVQHSPAGSVVTIDTRIRGDVSGRVEISVRDRGDGFAAEDLPKVFTPFFSRRAGGFGLGLAISERIVGEHGGRLTAGNHPDGGAVLCVELPFGAGDPPASGSEGVHPW